MSELRCIVTGTFTLVGWDEGTRVVNSVPLSTIVVILILSTYRKGEAKVYVYSPYILSRFNGLYTNYPQV